MKTNITKIHSNGKGMETALKEAERFTDYLELDKKSASRLRLLTEETLGMVRAIAGEFDAELWFESEKDKVCEIHLSADANIDYDMKQELVAASSSGKNESERGFMGMIKGFFESGIRNFEEVDRLQVRYGTGPIAFGALGMYDIEGVTAAPYIWSMEQYRSNLAAEMKKEAAAKEAWDELEKSIVANIADDVKVAVKGTHVEMTIVKRF